MAAKSTHAPGVPPSSSVRPDVLFLSIWTLSAHANIGRRNHSQRRARQGLGDDEPPAAVVGNAARVYNFTPSTLFLTT
jgi:hypothetical protein